MKISEGALVQDPRGGGTTGRREGGGDFFIALERKAQKKRHSPETISEEVPADSTVQT